MKMRAAAPVYSLRAQLTLTLTVAALLCLAILGLVSYRTMRSIEQSRLQTSTMSDIRQLSEQMRLDYLSLIHISQQMIAEGSVGVLLDSYLGAQTPYDRIVASRTISENITLTTFSNPQVELVTYYAYERGRAAPYFSNLSARESFDPANLPQLSQTPYIAFQPPHQSQSRFHNGPVISLTRETSFSDGTQRSIYVEARSNTASQVAQMSHMQNMPCYLLQLDESGAVCYSELPVYPVGSRIDLSTPDDGQSDMGRVGNYVWVRARVSLGFDNVLLIPAADYNREINAWKLEILLIGAIALILIFFTSISLYNQVYHPLMVMEHEMHRFGGGDLAVRPYHFRIREFDALFSQFNRLKGQIGELMSDIYRQEQEKRQLELDKLYYQINPHFLMNALNSAHWLALMRDQEEIAVYLNRLNYLLGYTLGKATRNATLRSELEVLTAYLELQKVRYDFHVWSDVEPGLYLERPCARLILQPLAENAIGHSVDDFGNLWITVRETEDGMIRVVMHDDGRGFDPALLSFRDPPRADAEGTHRRGIGLRYVWLTLEAFYQQRARMEIDSAPGAGTSVTLFLPTGEGDKDDPGTDH